MPELLPLAGSRFYEHCSYHSDSVIFRRSHTAEYYIGSPRPPDWLLSTSATDYHSRGCRNCGIGGNTQLKMSVELYGELGVEHGDGQPATSRGHAGVIDRTGVRAHCAGEVVREWG